jgi:iron(III) transport system substrate-binding protein
MQIIDRRVAMRGAVLTAAALMAGLSGGPARAASGKLVLYTSQPDKIAAETVAAFNKREPQVEVEIFRSGTTEIINKIQAELVGGAPRADVLFIADAVSMEQLKADGRLASYAVDKTYFGTKLITTGIIYNKAAPTVPKSWKDLLKPEAKGQVVLPSPLYSGAAAIHMAAIEAMPMLGTNYYMQLAANGADAAKGNGAVVTSVAGGQKMYGVIVEFMALNAKAKGSPVDFVFPAEGVSAVTEPVAILKTARNPDAARAFVRFVLSKEGQELAVAQGFLPARTDVAPPAGFPKTSDLHIMPVDMAKTAADADLLKRQFTDLFGG